jgi:hypothetical protein
VPGSDQRIPAQELKDLVDLLGCVPVFRVARVPRNSRVIGLVSSAVKVFKTVRCRMFSAEFDGCLTLLSYRIRMDGPSAILVDLLWYADQIPLNWWVFVHFLDEEGSIRLQGDYSLPHGPTGRLRLLPNQRRIDVPEALRGNAYRLRLGVWSPVEGRHLPLTKFRGCVRDAAGGLQNAVVLGSYSI